jgi:hypothetical protein
MPTLIKPPKNEESLASTRAHVLCHPVHTDPYKLSSKEEVDLGQSLLKTPIECGQWALILHDVNIMSVGPNGEMFINTGAWRSPSTLEALATHMPKGWSINSQWEVVTPGGVFPVVDNMTINGAGDDLVPGVYKIDRKSLSKRTEYNKLWGPRVKYYVETFYDLLDTVGELETDEMAYATTSFLNDTSSPATATQENAEGMVENLEVNPDFERIVRDAIYPNSIRSDNRRSMKLALEAYIRACLTLPFEL